MSVSKKQAVAAGAFPLTVLTAINFFDLFDSSAFSVLAPEIREAFDLTNRGLTTITAVNVIFTTLFVLPLGYYADRLPRRAFVIVSALVATMFSFATGLAVGLWVLVAIRLANGVGRLINDPVHTSLLSDYYPPEERGQIFAVHRAAEPLGAIAGPLAAGGIAALLGWRWAFMGLAIPAFIVAVIALRLPEPLRGRQEDEEAALEAAKEPPIPFGRAYRILRNVKTLRRIWLAAFFAGAGSIPLMPVFTLYWEEIWDKGSFARGAILASGAGASLLGILAVGRITNRLMATAPEKAQLYAGLALAVNAALLLVMAAAPSFPVALGAFLVISAGFGVYQPPSVAVASVVIPPRVRTQGFAYTPLYMALGAIVASPLGGVADAYGYRWTLFAFSPVLILAGLTFASAYRFVPGDAQRSVAVLEAEAFLHSQGEAAGERSLLLCRNLDVSYGTVPVLHNVNLDVREGEIVALLGTNGAGKSTLLRAIAGLVHGDRGVLFFDGRDITFHEPEETAAEGILLSPGGQGIFPDMTVGECLLSAAWALRGDPAAVRERVDEVVALFPRLAERMHQTTGTMSGGEQQMVALAQAMMTKPRLLMIDELTLGLAPKVVGELLEAVRAINASGVTVILVEQSVNVALMLAERAFFMERGRIMFDGPTSELIGRSDLLRSVFLRPEALT